jgi:hypothetical protein
MTTFHVEVDDEEWSAAPSAQRQAIKRLLPRLQEEPTRAGDRIQRARIPKPYREYAAFYRIPLPDGWRALYGLRSRRDEPAVVRIVFIGDHKRYDRLLGYKSS